MFTVGAHSLEFVLHKDIHFQYNFLTMEISELQIDVQQDFVELKQVEKPVMEWHVEKLDDTVDEGFWDSCCDSGVDLRPFESTTYKHMNIHVEDETFADEGFCEDLQK